MATERNEIFAGRSIRFWAQYTEQELLTTWGFNERQIPQLKEQLDFIELKLKKAEKVEKEETVIAEDEKPVKKEKKARE